MSPKLRGQDIPRSTLPAIQPTVVHDGEVRVTCPREDCYWSTIRPERAAWSAGEAHRIRHARGETW